MKSIVVPAVLAIALAAAGTLFWTMGKAEEKLAEAHRQLSVLQYADASTDSDASANTSPLVRRIANLGGADEGDARELHATADYWQTRYAALEPKHDATGNITETDPQVLLLAANGAFRLSQADTDRSNALRRLDGVVKGYGEVLKSASPTADAAYNYEYAIRVRDMLQKAKTMSKSAAARAAIDATDTDLPAGTTLHGRPGGPPSKTDMAQFKIVIPKRGEERKDDPQAGKGNTKIRKG